MILNTIKEKKLHIAVKETKEFKETQTKTWYTDSLENECHHNIGMLLYLQDVVYQHLKLNNDVNTPIDLAPYFADAHFSTLQAQHAMHSEDYYTYWMGIYPAMAWSTTTNLYNAEVNGRLDLFHRITTLAGFRWSEQF